MNPLPSHLPSSTPPERPGRPARASEFWWRTAGVAGICLFLAGAGTSQRVRPDQQRLAPQTEIEVQAVKGVVAECQPDHALQTERGRMPPQARISHHLVWRSTHALPLTYAEKELATEAKRRCGDGITLQKAIADEGAKGVVEVRAVSWVLSQPPPP